MASSTILMLVSAIAVLGFFLVIAFALMRIDPLLERIGGLGDSYLAKLRLGLRAIDRETSHLPVAVPRINAGLGELAGGLMAVDATLGEAYASFVTQKEAPK